MGFAQLTLIYLPGYPNINSKRKENTLPPHLIIKQADHPGFMDMRKKNKDCGKTTTHLYGWKVKETQLHDQ